MTAEELERAVLTFVNDHLLRGKATVTASDRLFEDGYLDSLRVLELIAFIEEAVQRKVPDRGVRLANFRSVRAIARAFGGDARLMDASPEPLYDYHTTPERFASPIDELRRRRELIDAADGSSRLAGIGARLFGFFDATFARWARELGADDSAAPASIAMATLERAGFLTDFPQLLVRGGATESQAYSPAACYHRYAELADAALDGATVLGVHARCRRAEPEPRPLERSIEFTMREVVVLGTHQDVERVRHRLLRRVDRFVTALALDGAIEPASDPFFTSASTGRVLAQHAGGLKLELRLSLEDGRRVAVASFNRHHDYFGRCFGISLPDGSTAHSGCVAFGIERWVLAYLTQHGFDERAWPHQVRDALEIQRAHAALT
jgi:acyl carrier protein